MKILIYIPVYLRRVITEICYTGLQRIRAKAPSEYESRVLIVASTDEDEQLAQRFGFDTYRTANTPLGAKFNSGLEYALSVFDFDYILQLNSDDLLSVEFWDSFRECLSRRIPYFGIDSLYFIDSVTKEIKEFRYALGCGIRFIRRDIVEQSGFIVENGAEVFRMWTPDISSGLDHDSDEHILVRANVAQRFVRTRVDYEPLVVDIKSDVNIHPFTEFVSGRTLNEKEARRVYKRFPELRLLT